MSRGIAMKNQNTDADVPIDVYKEICAHIRATDDISFKLLGLVPITSGAGIGLLVFFQKGDPVVPAPAVCLLSLLGAAATAAIFAWELRNVQRCVWLMHQAAAFETEHFEIRQV